MDPTTNVYFDDMTVAFDYKCDADRRIDDFILSLVKHPWISFLATGFTKIAFKAGLPIDGIIKKTAFDHFCGGESIEESEAVIQQLAKYRVRTILDFSVEGEKSEQGFDDTMEEVLRTI